VKPASYSCGRVITEARGSAERQKKVESVKKKGSKDRVSNLAKAATRSPAKGIRISKKKKDRKRARVGGGGAAKESTE